MVGQIQANSKDVPHNIKARTEHNQDSSFHTTTIPLILISSYGIILQPGWTFQSGCIVL